MYLASGIRKIDGAYFLRNISSIQPQFKGEFVKLELSLYRKTKNANFAYLPSWLYQELLSVMKGGKTSVCGLELHIKPVLGYPSNTAGNGFTPSALRWGCRRALLTILRAWLA